jgi:hypothetical protein
MRNLDSVMAMSIHNEITNTPHAQEKDSLIIVHIDWFGKEHTCLAALPSVRPGGTARQRCKQTNVELIDK